MVLKIYQNANSPQGCGLYFAKYSPQPASNIPHGEFLSTVNLNFVPQRNNSTLGHMLSPCLALLCTVSDPNFENSACLLVVPQVVPKRFCGVLDTLEEFRYTRKGRGHKYCCGAVSNTLWNASVIKIPVRFARCQRRWGRISPQAWGTPRGQVHLGSGFQAYRCRATAHLAICHRPWYARQGSRHKL